MSGLARKFTAASVAAALFVVPTGAIAASPAPVPQPTAQQAAAAASANPWLTLSAMTSSSSSAATAAAAQGDDGPGFPPIAPLIVILGTIALAVWILVHDDGDDDTLDFEPEPTSP
ncbi:MAG: hypothetical protein ACJ8FC_03655 [Sphingomicrobium sp.]|jgi:hypothetical protein